MFHCLLNLFPWDKIFFTHLQMQFFSGKMMQRLRENVKKYDLISISKACHSTKMAEYRGQIVFFPPSLE